MNWGEESKEKFSLNFGMDEISRDLYPNRNTNLMKLEDIEKEEEIELSLGLSLNGRFGVDPSSKKFKRSSSVMNLVFTAENCSIRGPEQPELVRTRSLPTAAEEELHRRKEWLNMRRLDARKKRMEKLKNLRALKSNGSHDSLVEFGGDGGGETPSSCTSDLSLNGSKQACKIQQRKCEVSVNGESEKAIAEMPYVSTKGDGPDKVDGFLYRYKKGEEVRILCVCHGFFLSPAEFVKHGGGDDVDNPLKHIVVNPFPLV